MSQFNETMNKKAVALSYDEEKDAAPVIVASGMGYMAEKIVETARESGVPVYEDNSLATVLSQLQLGSQVPEQLYQAIVDIYVYFLRFANKRNLSAELAPENAEHSENAEEKGEEGTRDAGAESGGADAGEAAGPEA